jgi:hypothetical protein
MQDPQGVDWPLGFIQVVTPGTPVNLMSLVDPGNNNAPGTPTGPGLPARAEYTPTCHKIFVQAVVPANNGGMQLTQGNVYVLRALGPGNQNSGGPGNRSDPGAMVACLFPGGFFTLPAQEFDGPTISPYRYTIDADVATDGVLAVAINCSRG